MLRDRKKTPMLRRAEYRIVKGFKIPIGIAFTAMLALGASPFQTGNVLVAVGNSQVKVFTPNGTLLTTLNDASGTPFTTGMVFDASNNLFVTNFDAPTISKFDSNGNLVSSAFMNASNTPESILVNGAGNFIVGGPGAATLLQYSSAGGSPTVTYNVQGGNGTNGTDWADLAADQQTILYDGEGNEILSYNLATRTQNAPFATGLPGSSVFEFRIIPSGPFAGDVLAADSSAALLLNPSGAVIQTYTLPGNGGLDFALNLDPNGRDFWTADAATGNVWEVNISTGAIDQQWNSGDPQTTFGLVVVGQLTAAISSKSGDAPFQVRYAANLNFGESYIDITNTGANGAPVSGPGFGGASGNICANVYAFDPNEELIACCSCLVTPGQTVNLGVNVDLTAKTFSGVIPTSVTIKLLATLAGTGGSATTCTTSAASPSTTSIVSGMAAFGTTLHGTPTAGTYATTETPFTPATLSAAELASIAGRCAGIIGNASGFGICSSCKSGALGGSKL